MNKQKKNYSRIQLNQHNSIHKCTELELFFGRQFVVYNSSANIPFITNKIINKNSFCHINQPPGVTKQMNCKEYN